MSQYIDIVYIYEFKIRFYHINWKKILFTLKILWNNNFFIIF